MTESKQKIANKLCAALKATRAYSSIDCIRITAVGHTTDAGHYTKYARKGG